MNPRSAITTITDWQTLSKKVKVDTNSSTSPNLFNVDLGSVQGRIQGGGGRVYCPSSPPPPGGMEIKNPMGTNIGKSPIFDNL